MQIVAKRLSHTYNLGAKFASEALNDVSLNIETGEFFGIIGHTGSGKSTFIQHLNALIEVQSGELDMGEINLPIKKKKEKKKYKELRKKVGIVFQYPEYQLFAATVFEDVAFGLKNFYPELKNDEIERRVKIAIETVGLDYFDIKEKSPFDLSGGQKRRVAIAGVIVANPEVLVLDEPVAGLDPQGKKELWNILHALNDDGKRTVIVVSHDMNDVSENCDRIAVFNKSKVIFVGKAKDFFSNGQLVNDTGLDVPVTTYLAERLKVEGIVFDTDFKVVDFAEKLANILKEKGVQ